MAKRITTSIVALITTAFSLSAAAPVHAQSRFDAPPIAAPQRTAALIGHTNRQSALMLSSAVVQQTGASAFLVEAAGGIAGSLAGVGLGIVALSGGCGSEDLVCNLQRAGTVVLIGTIGSAAGAYAAGHWQGTDPSLLGGALGAVVGAAAGLGVIHLLKEDLNVTTSETALLVSFSVTQGLTTALGSRLLSR